MTGPAWDRLLADVRGSDYGERTLRDAYEAGREDVMNDAGLAERIYEARLDAYRAGADGRGSRARYRRAVVGFLNEVDERIGYLTEVVGSRPEPTVLPYVDSLGGHHQVDAAQTALWHLRAARRARAILARLDSGRR